MLCEITPLFLHYAHNQPSKMCRDHRRLPVNLVTVAKEMIRSLILRNYNQEHQPSTVAKRKKHISSYEHTENSHSVLIENCQSERKMWVVFVKQSECQQGQRCSIVLPVLATGYTSVSHCCCQQVEDECGGQIQL